MKLTMREAVLYMARGYELHVEEAFHRHESVVLGRQFKWVRRGTAASLYAKGLIQRVRRQGRTSTYTLTESGRVAAEFEREPEKVQP